MYITVVAGLRQWGKDRIENTSREDGCVGWYVTVFTLSLGIFIVVTHQNSSSRQSSSILNHSKMVPFDLLISFVSVIGLADDHFRPFKQLRVLCLSGKGFLVERGDDQVSEVPR